MKYKVGDRVRIKNLDWYNRHTNGTEIDCGGVPFTSDMKWFCSCVMTISFVHADCYAMVEDLENYYTDEMIEGLVEEENKVGTALNPIELKSNANCLTREMIEEFTEEENEKKLSDESWRYKNIFDSSQYPQSFELPEGYIFKDENGNVINATKIVLEKKKKEYPKTYEECCRIMDIDTGFLLTSYDLDFWKGYLLTSLQKLLICRDAYWKIAGEEMGLGKPWEPDWADTEIKYCIANSSIGIKKSNTYDFTRILSFPTEEMRDAFKENFDPDIEFCKELL